ncbi:MAG: complex I subunit 5 family protein, partial [Opitutales bacterium]
TARTFLFLTAGLWTLAGWFAWPYSHAMPRLRAYTIFTLLSYAGNLGIYLATDVALFYSAFAVMTFASVGLVLHSRKPEAVRAGVLYIFMAVLGEVLILTGLLWLTFQAGTIEIAGLAAAGLETENTGWLIALLLFGFGVKAGLLPVHVWLPLAHPVAPTPASAVLSGAMVKAGLFGWITFLPGGSADFPAWGTTCITLGLTAAFAAAYAGITQANAKATLAYSSISQLGLMAFAVGIGLASAEAWEPAVGLLAFFALNHAFAKGALFMADGASHVAEGKAARWFVLAGSGLAALVIAGFPLTGGELAKNALKKLALQAPDAFAAMLDEALLVSSFATTVLLGRFIQLIHKGMARHHPVEQPRLVNGALLVTWGLAIAACLALPQLSGGFLALSVKAEPWSWKTLISASPILVGMATAFLLLPRAHALPRVPAGDLGLAALGLGGWTQRFWMRHVSPRLERTTFDPDPWLRAFSPPGEAEDGNLDRADEASRQLPLAGVVALVLLVVLYWCLA